MRECLRQLDANVLRSKFHYHEFKAFLLQEIDRRTEIGSSMTLHDMRLGWSRSFFARGSGRLEKPQLDPAIAALAAGMATLQTPKSFLGFFAALADFAEKLRLLDPQDPLLLFQRCAFALEQLSWREQSQARKDTWDAWMDAWRVFLEFYRACTACVLNMPGPSPGSSPRKVLVDSWPDDQSDSQMSGSGSSPLAAHTRGVTTTGNPNPNPSEAAPGLAAERSMSAHGRPRPPVAPPGAAAASGSPFVDAVHPKMVIPI